jgi:hypothetical protein
MASSTQNYPVVQKTGYVRAKLLTLSVSRLSDRVTRRASPGLGTDLSGLGIGHLSGECQKESTIPKPCLISDVLALVIAGVSCESAFRSTDRGLAILIGEVVLARGFINNRSNGIGVERQVCFAAIDNRVQSQAASYGNRLTCKMIAPPESG